MYDEERARIRLQCIQYALGTCGESTPEHVLNTAKRFEKWVTNTEDKLED